MMRVRWFSLGALLLIVAGRAGAQQNVCPAGSTTLGVPDQNRATQDACQMAVDVFQYIAPQLGIAMTGGNPTLGQGGVLGGLGHFAVEVRGNALAGDIPQIQNFPTPGYNGRQQRT